MKLVNNIKIRVFCYPDEDEQKIRGALIFLVDQDLVEQKIFLEETFAKGFNQKKIKIFSLELNKDRHSNHFLKRLKSLLSDEDNDYLSGNLKHVDSDFKFYVRLDKNSLLENNLILTDKGNCFHVSVSLAVFPRKLVNAKKLLNNIFS